MTDLVVRSVPGDHLADRQRCENCGGTGTDSTLVATDPYPIYMPHPCGYCQGLSDQGGTEMADEENDITATGQCCCAGCAGMGPCDRADPEDVARD